MSLPHIAVAWKIAAIIGTATAVAVIAMDPTIEIAIITGASLIGAALIAGGFSVVLQVMSYRLQKASHTIQSENKDVLHEVADHVDGINSRLFAEKAQLKIDKDKQGAQLADTSVQLAHQEGMQQERVEERARQSDAKETNNP
jgi:hypothetical protein